MFTFNNQYLEHVYSGMFKNNLAWKHRERIMDSYEIIIVLQNDLHICEENINYNLSLGDILLLEPYKKHFGTEISKNGCCFYWLHFKTNMSLNFKYFNLHSTNQKDHILFLVSQLINVSRLHQYSKETCDALCYAIIEYLSVANQNHFNKDDKIVNEIINYINQNCYSPLSVEKISNYFNYNANYISTTFKNKTNIGLKQYLNNITINNAKMLLITTNLSIKQIAATLKFSSLQNFISFFKYHENISPQQYRKANLIADFNIE